MRDISAKVVGSLVLVLGAMVALAAGVLLPILGGFGLGSIGAAPVAATRLSAPDKDVQSAQGAPGRSPPAASPAIRVRRPVMTGALAAAAEMPSSADMVLVVENAADLRTSPIGDATVRFLLDASGMAQTREAWSTLAAQLGWSEIETFDRLLGQRVVLVARDFGQPESARWALLSDVSPETDTRLKERLTASQRSIDQGHQILTVEKGKYELTSHKRAPKGPVSAVTIVLGPAGRSELFDEMVDVLASGSRDTLADHGVIESASSAGPSEILLLTRLGPGQDRDASTKGSAEDRWADFFVFASVRACVSAANSRSPVPSRAGAAPVAAADPSQFTSRVIYRDRARSAANLAIPTSSDAAFRALVPGSLFTIVQAAPVQQILGDSARLLDALRDLPLPEPAQKLLGARQVVSLREVAPPGGDVGSKAKHLAGVLALETTSTTRIAPLLDGSISRFIAAREQQFGVTRPPPHDFGGRLPKVTRVMPLDVPDGNPLRLFVPDPLTLAWSYPVSRGAEDSALAPAENCAGWWVMSITPTPAGLESLPEEAHNQVAAALSEDRSDADAAGGRPARWIWLGALRAADLERRLPSPTIVPDIGGFRSALKRFENVRIELSINDAGDIQGDLTAKLAQTPAK